MISRRNSRIKEQIALSADTRNLILTRAQQGYGFDIRLNIELSSLSLLEVWRWIEKSDNGQLGLLATVSAGRPARETHVSSFVVYDSEARLKALQSLSWTDLISPAKLEGICRELELGGQCTLSALIAILHFNLGLAAKALGYTAYKALQTLLQTISFADLENPKIKEYCIRLGETFPEPYLSFGLGFMGDSIDNCTLNLDKLRMSDRLAFACRFLDDSQLKNYLHGELEKGTVEGSLSTLMITGLSDQAIQIIDRYLRSSEDIQTTAILSVFLQEKLTDDRLEEWIEHYRQLLNSEKLWHVRCKFDISHRRMRKTSVEPYLGLYCYYCNTELTLPRMLSTRLLSKKGWSDLAQKALSNHCPECNKQLPRCAVCLVPFSSFNPYLEKARELREPGAPKPALPLGDWFCWCEKCRHGGHVSHINEWFSNNSKCPVASCECPCASLDSGSY
jgi:hypothetical protein